LVSEPERGGGEPEVFSALFSFKASEEDMVYGLSVGIYATVSVGGAWPRVRDELAPRR
jgi:hypothetical protein